MTEFEKLLADELRKELKVKRIPYKVGKFRISQILKKG